MLINTNGLGFLGPGSEWSWVDVPVRRCRGHADLPVSPGSPIPYSERSGSVPGFGRGLGLRHADLLPTGLRAAPQERSGRLFAEFERLRDEYLAVFQDREDTN